MIRQMLLTIALAVSMLVVSNTAHAQLAPQRASDLVTLNINPAERCDDGEGFRMNIRVLSNGFTEPFSIPAGQVFVITDWQWFSSAIIGANAFEGVALVIETVQSGKHTVGVAGNNTPGAAGAANGVTGSSASIVNLVAVKPVAHICVVGTANPNPFAIVHGFLAPDM
jgi:hypothetical protein